MSSDSNPNLDSNIDRLQIMLVSYMYDPVQIQQTKLCIACMTKVCTQSRFRKEQWPLPKFSLGSISSNPRSKIFGSLRPLHPINLQGCCMEIAPGKTRPCTSSPANLMLYLSLTESTWNLRANKSPSLHHYLQGVRVCTTICKGSEIGC